MGITQIVGLLGGLALFLYGMHMMSAGMEAAAGSRMKQILERLTTNRFLGVLVGAGITAIIQSSSATTVMVVGFVNSGMMTLRQAVWIIMGANIGTTITGQLIALDVGVVAPLVAFAGVVMIVFLKQPRLHHIGSILAGLGILFIGMDMMSSSMMPLRDSEVFIDLMTKFSNPVLGILAGTLFTAVIQSSSASVGILQALAVSGAIGLESAVFVLFGQNIGTCITALLASIGTSRNAKRTTVIHLSFNLIGTVLFTAICILTPLTGFMKSVTPSNPAAQIANMHTLFNIVTTLLLLPFGELLARLAEKILPGDEEVPEGHKLLYLENVKNIQDGNFGASAINLDQTEKEIRRMLDMAAENVHNCFTSFMDRDSSWIPKVEEKEEYVDNLNREISKYLSAVMTYDTNEERGRIFSAYFKITGNIERISDHAMNVCDYSKMLSEKGISFSEHAREEILQMQVVCDKLMSTLLGNDLQAVEALSRSSALEQRIDDMTEEYRTNMIRRIKNRSCSEEGSILYSELLTDFERIGDHALNISQLWAEIRGLS